MKPNQTANTCVTCPIGYICLGINHRQACPAGYTTRVTGLSSLYDCSVCEAGTVCEGHGRAQTICPSGRYGPSQGATHISMCLPCQAGRFGLYRKAINKISCQPCSSGKYSAVIGSNTSKFCIPCPSGYACSAGSANPWPCALGKASPGNTSACSSCSVGRYSAQTRGRECSLCPPGKYTSSTSSIECALCPEGTFQYSYGHAMCKPFSLNVAFTLSVVATLKGTGVTYSNYWKEVMIHL